MKNPVHVWEYHGTKYCAGLFELLDQEGFPLADSLQQCQQRGWLPCLHDFMVCALRAGWSREKAEKVIAQAQCDSGVFIHA